MDSIILAEFHGDLFSNGPWNSHSYSCCRLCKTKNTEGNKRHWAKGLCKSCYRRLLLSHKQYNDAWLAEHKKKSENLQPKTKAYKNLDKLEVADSDIDTVLERYGFCCAYCGTKLQCHSFKDNDAFQLEILITPQGTQLVPACRSCNCSKKNLIEDRELEKWARKKKLKYPFRLIPPPLPAGSK